MSKETIIEWAPWESLINETFIPLVEDRSRYIVCYGGRASGKSVAIAKILVYRCLNENYYKCLLIRREYNSIKESSYATLKDVIEEMGLSEFFDFKVSPLEIVCLLNGNRFIARGLDSVDKIKSVRDVTCAHWEEEIPSHSDFITVTTSIRTNRADYLTEYFTVQPEVEGQYQDHWFYKYFGFADHDEKSFKGSAEVETDSGQIVRMKYTVHHSTYRNNKWITPEVVGFLNQLKTSNPYYYQIYCEGYFGNKILGGTFFKNFRMGINTAKVKYDPLLPLHLSFDFNCQPGVSCGVFQIENKVMTMIDEVQLKSPMNNTASVCRELCRKYNDHEGGIFFTADASGRHEDTRSIQGHNDLTLIEGGLRKFSAVRNMTPKLNPSVSVSAAFINSIFEAGEAGYKGMRIVIGENCHKMIADLLNLLEDDEGGALKQRVKDSETGLSFEKYGHFGDLLRYAVATFLATGYNVFKQGDRKGSGITLGSNVSKNSDWGDSYKHGSYYY